jgi:hypothetical protein
MATLTDVSIRSLSSPESGFKIYLDDIVRGFGVRVSLMSEPAKPASKP